MKAVHAILLVEDNPADIKITRRALRESGMPVDLLVARDGEEALEYLLRDGRYAGDAAWRVPDLVLLDLNLPRLTGRQVLERIRGTPALRALPVVVLTTSHRLEDVQDMYNAGANTYIEKPQDFNLFVDVLRAIQRYWLEVALLPPSPGELGSDGAMDPLEPDVVKEALGYWYGLINYEQLTPQMGDLNLERMRALLGALDNPEQQLRIVHVAGSKGKGSTAAMLAAILRSAGYRTGLFTSPHLVDVYERFQVDGQAISPEELASWLLKVRDTATYAGLSDTGGGDTSGSAASGLLSATPTFFEVATAAGLLHFAGHRVETAILEVGLGGRFDSTNVCDPAVALITSISYDHTRILGDKLASIAFEKAGILKPGRPAISGATVSEARNVIDRVAHERGCPLRLLGRDFSFAYRPGRVTEAGQEKARVRVRTERRTWPELELNLLGEHQAANAAVVVACVEELVRQGWRLPDSAVAAGLAEVCWPARLEVLGRRPLMVLDCAHNVASAMALTETLNSSFPPGRRLLIFAGSSDKDIAGMFRALAPNFDAAFLTRYTNNPRAVPGQQLAEILAAASPLPATIHESPAAALTAARAQAGINDLICITGSVFLAGEVRPLLTTGPVGL